ncbi:mitochondrial ribosomal death-associated protein 3-domain-containing protein [Rhypophila decipiens]|uniref:Small ribosomal subunit protein mS29 n=1 Tax=Rhypophila decipiens TaxID=261697 RepID=A0AAN7BDI2_9PEZI|nr:mitochondrial ribosomal death-associated protein 3-domain-containing protein [Rhypophila decipiens]
MSVPNCMRCLTRPSAVATAALRPFTVPVSVSLTAAGRVAAFSTTPAQQATPQKGSKTPAGRMDARIKRMANGHVRVGKRLHVGGKKGGTRPKAPLPGERKAYRKRIQLSNSNALPVKDLAELDGEHMLSEKNVAKVLSLPTAVIDQLRTVEAFKPTQTWGLFRDPSLLIRPETVDLMNRMQDSVANKQTLRLVIDGDKLTGKSILLLQALTQAFLKDWIVINIPEAQELTAACTEYAPIPGTEPVQYMQQVYILKLIQAIRKANEKVLSRLTTAYAHPELPQHIPVSSPILALANAAKEPDSAWTVFSALWKELSSNIRGRPPILFALDGLHHIMKISKYRNAAFDLIHSHDLALIKLFTDYLSGQASLPNGGAIIAATSRNNCPVSASLELALEQRLATQNGEEPPAKKPYFKGYDSRVEGAMKSAQVLRIKGVSKLETRSLMEYWAASGLLRTTVDEVAVSEKWMLGGNGVLGEMERASLLTMRL